jgi:hypothetical protein
MFLKDFARNLESKESLYQALKRLERAGLDVSTINSTSVKLFTDDAGRHHANKDCSSRQDGYYSTRNPVWRKRPYVLGSQERRMSVGHLLGIHSSSVCWRCTQREVDRMISAEFETLLAVFEVESLEGVNISARADQNSLTRPHIILAILSKSPAGRNSARIRTAQQTLKLHLEKASLF